MVAGGRSSIVKIGSTFRLVESMASFNSTEACKSSQRGVRLFSMSVPISCRDALRVVPPERMKAWSRLLPRRWTGLTVDSGT